MAISAEPRRLALADLELHVGVVLGPTAPLEVSQERINRFGDVTEDRQWIHIDPARAAAGPFGATIAHGFLTLSLVSWALDGLLVVPDAEGAINYGLDRVRFPSPVIAGSTVSATAEIGEVRREESRVFMKTRVVLTATGAAKPCCVADVLTLYLPRATLPAEAVQ